MGKLPKIEIDPEEIARVMGEMHENLGPPGPSDPGLTRKELAEQWGVSTTTAKDRIQRLIDEGLVIRGKGWRRDRNSRWQPVPVYRPKEKADD